MAAAPASASSVGWWSSGDRFALSWITAVVLVATMAIAWRYPLSRGAPDSDGLERAGNLRGTLNVNTATADELAALPGIGLSYAQRIVEARGHSPLRTLDDLSAVKGLGPARSAKLKPYLRFSDN